MFHKNIDRQVAQNDFRQLMVIANAASSEGFTSHSERLQAEIGTVVTFDGAAEKEEIDRVGLHALAGKNRMI